MLPNRYPSQDCSIARSLEIVGERWTLLVVREALLGATSFDDFEQGLGIAPNTLARRLEDLTEHEVFARAVDPTDRRRKIYTLTEKGRRLGLVVESLRQWGDQYGGETPPATHTHQSCGGDLHVSLTCRQCGDPITSFARDIVRHEHRPLRVED